PLKVNQWCNIIRIDTKDTKPLLRDREFQWTEAHTCHATPEEAVEQVKESMWIYGSFYDECCLPYLITKRPKYDTFPGALYSIAYDTPMPDGKTLQIGTTHNLDQGFAKVFDIKFQKDDGSHDFAYQTCYGLSTRVVAAVIGVHGDDRGLILPPFLAPLQVVIIPILFKGKEKAVIEESKAILELIKESNMRVKFDDSDKTSGFKFNEYELQGVPVRVEIGPQEVEKKGVTLARRDTKERVFVEKDKLVETIKDLFNKITEELKIRAKQLLEDSISTVNNYEELKDKFTGKLSGFVRANWCGDEECADLIKEKLKAEIRGTLYGEKEETYGLCVICNEEATEVAYISRAY
ncbi:MAG: aminoacyl--tRNA ligase-related protein, partial [Candidatus Heimdallarchaeaceae archaeon]